MKMASALSNYDPIASALKHSFDKVNIQANGIDGLKVGNFPRSNIAPPPIGQFLCTFLCFFIDILGEKNEPLKDK